MPDVNDKADVDLQIWVRPTFYWDLNCDWSPSGMNRTSALTYYGQSFQDMNFPASEDLKTEMLIAVTALNALATILIFVFPKMQYILPVLIFDLVMILTVGITTIFVFIDYYNSQSQSVHNSKVIEDQETFNPFSTRCGDELNSLDYDQANTNIGLPSKYVVSILANCYAIFAQTGLFGIITTVCLVMNKKCFKEPEEDKPTFNFKSTDKVEDTSAAEPEQQKPNYAINNDDEQQQHLID